MSNKKVNLIEGDILKTLAKLTWPMLFGMLGLIIFNLTDTFYIGRLGVSELAAISFTFPVVTVINSIGQGIGIGTASLVSRSFTSKDRQTVREFASSAIVLAIIVVITFVIIGRVTLNPVFKLLGANDQLRPLVLEYMKIWIWGVPFVVIPVVGNNIIRATGDTFTPGMIMIASAVFNIVLDPILIFGIGPIPAMSLKGAALATVISRSLGLMVALYVLIKKENLLTRQLPRFKEMLQTWKNILFVAVPATAGKLITPLSIAVITRIIAGYGKEPVAAFGVVSRIEMFVLMIVASLASVMTIFSGQNWGANKKDRIMKGYKIASIFSLSWGALLFVICLLLAPQLSGIFSADKMVVDISSQFLRIASVSYGFLGIVMLSGSVLNGINKPLKSMMITLTRMFILYVPLAYFASKTWGLSGIFWATVVANIATFAFAVWQVISGIERKRTFNKSTLSR